MTSLNLPAESTFSLKSTIQNLPKVSSLHRRLLIGILPTVLIPLLIASGIGYNIAQNRIKKQAISQLENNAILTSEAVSIFIRDSFYIADTVAINPMVIEAMEKGAAIAESEKLIQQPIKTIEGKFATTKLLEPNPTLNKYLEKIVKNGNVSEIFFTERNGFNVAFSNPTSDFVQSDENWWQTSEKNGTAIDEPEYDDSAKAVVIALSKAVKHPDSGKFLGVIKSGIPVTALDSNIAKFLSTALSKSQSIQVVDTKSGNLVNTISVNGADPKRQDLIGGVSILTAAKTVLESNPQDKGLVQLQTQSGFSDVTIARSANTTNIRLQYADKIYSLATIPNTNLIAIASVNVSEIEETGRDLLTAFGLTSLILGALALTIIGIIARQLSNPLAKLSQKVYQAAEGNLNVRADLQGTLETVTLAHNFNNSIDKVRELLEQQERLTQEQRQQKENLEREIFLLLEEVSPATEGDLTVRANLSSLEISTIADLVNAIIDSLQEIAVEVKQSTQQVSNSLKQKEADILAIAQQSSQEAQATQNTLNSVEEMSRSIQEIANNASETAQIVNDTYTTVRQSTDAMAKTVDSIVDLRDTIGDTAKKMKRLGESSQKISQVVSLIEEIALKTNLLAINASVEASRAGERGQGFTVVAEQVASLAEQSGTAIKEIAQIVASIQKETQQVTQAMETSTAQVVDTTRLVESTKESLGIVLKKAQTIDRLMGSISQATVSQANTSQVVASSIQQIAELSQQSLTSSRQVAQSMVETAQIAQKLESTVAKFKVTADKA
jgi:twitching motility protein PilJ